jgi:hypothetical protein
LLCSASVEEAARVVGVTAQRLGRWMKDKQFGAEYRAAKRAEYRQSMARMGQGATAAVKSILQLVYYKEFLDYTSKFFSVVA